MGPLFSLLIVVLFGSPVALLVFAACKFFLPFRSAIIMTGAILAGGAIGLVSGLFIQILAAPQTLETRYEVIRFLSIVCLSGILFALLAAWIAWHRLVSSEAAKTGRMEP